MIRFGRRCDQVRALQFPTPTSCPPLSQQLTSQNDEVSTLGLDSVNTICRSCVWHLSDYDFLLARSRLKKLRTSFTEKLSKNHEPTVKEEAASAETVVEARDTDEGQRSRDQIIHFGFSNRLCVLASAIATGWHIHSVRVGA